MARNNHNNGRGRDNNSRNNDRGFHDNNDYNDNMRGTEYFDEARPNDNNNNNARQQFRQAPVQNNPRQFTEEVQKQQQILSNNFSSSQLSYDGSDKIVFLMESDIYENTWRRKVRKKLENQHHIRRFVNSCLIDTDKNGSDIEELVTGLGSPDGLNRIREIVMFEVSVDAGLQSSVASYQRVILPFLALLIRSGIINSVYETKIHAIYSVICSNMEQFIAEKVITMLEIIVERNSLVDNRDAREIIFNDDPDSFIPTSIGQFFLVIVRLLNQLLKRFKNLSSDPIMFKVYDRLEVAITKWKSSFQSRTSIIDTHDPIATNPDKPTKSTTTAQSFFSKLYKGIGLKIDSARTYDPPGDLSNDGPRHNNDHSDITKISIIPTKEEILCNREPFLPEVIQDAQHWLPHGPERLLDIRFRLLREDMLSPLRNGICSFVNTLNEFTKNNDARLKRFRENGRFKDENNKIDSGDLHLYNDIKFTNINVDKKRGLLCKVAFQQPRMRSARTEKDRQQYWEKSQKLMNGSLVCLIWPMDDVTMLNRVTTRINEIDNQEPVNNKYELFFGTVATRNEKAMAKDKNICEVEIEFMDIPTLQTIDPKTMPFTNYLASIPTDKDNKKVGIPTYASAPSFQFDLSVLLTAKNRNRNLRLNVTDKKSHDHVINELIQYSSLDDTQASALVSSLSKEIALIEGPPGTGKSYVGVQLMRVLLAPQNREATKLGPILTICFTNHALDQFLEDLFEAGLDNFVRLGSRSKSEVIREFNLEDIVRNRPKTPRERYLLAQAHKKLDEIRDSVNKINDQLNSPRLTWKNVASFLVDEYHEFYSKFNRKPDEIPSFLLDTYNVKHSPHDDDEWQTQDKKGRRINRHWFEQWLSGIDLQKARQHKTRLNQPDKNANGKKKATHNPFTYFISYLIDWTEPKRDRNLEELLQDTNIWRMSQKERLTLHDFWKQEINKELTEELSNLQRQYKENAKELERIFDQGRKLVLDKCDMIGMTTHGAAKYQSLIKSVNPRIIVCEEAGEVLEPHILSSLSPSTQHLILIGDHNQLRPRCATYNLTMDSRTGVKYQLDKSLFERLVHGDNAMKLEKSQLTTQRRMRAKEISDLIRRALYPNLVDHVDTKKYENVRGVQRNVYFLDHRHQEDVDLNEHAIRSHSNKYEVEMIVEMVKYFVRNGYTSEGDIAVLTPYLAQMIKIRDALKKKFVVLLDERDEKEISLMTEEDNEESENAHEESSLSDTQRFQVATKKDLNQKVTLRTVDNFQGEEAKIVIISLVRNSPNSGEEISGSIGFLKSTNRTNVLLSRAKHGMYLLGNADLMSTGSDMWKTVVNILRSREQVGTGFPIECNIHKFYKNVITEAKQFEEVSPDGGCFETCKQQLPCGHSCPYKCHSDDPEHVTVYCKKPCARMHRECGHPCSRLCGDDCGSCKFAVGDILLPCGHNYRDAKCDQERNITSIRCRKRVIRRLVHCEHEQSVECWKNLSDVDCMQRCGSFLPCEHECESKCHECQRRSAKAGENTLNALTGVQDIVRSHHAPCKKICDSNQFCGHICKESCHKGKVCPLCKDSCNISCRHSKCKLKCSEPCAACAEPCDWECEHQGQCNLSCGAPCSRLPCNEKCRKRLECGCECFGVCGETCPSKEYCINHASDNVKRQVADMVMQSTFEDVNWNEERMIVLECGHVFTMESMDGHMEMQDFYEGDPQGWTAIKPITHQPRKIKVCPNCRAPIKNIHRYGRVIKKFTLDVQNKKFLMTYELKLKTQKDRLENSIRTLETNRAKFLENIIKNCNNPTINYQTKNDNKNYRFDANEVTSYEKFGNLEAYSIAASQESDWKKHVKYLLEIYKELTSIISSTKTPPHKLAFEAAVTNLYNEKSKSQPDYDDLIKNFESSLNLGVANTARQKQQKLQETLQQVGIPTPQIDKRLYLEAFFEILNVQYLMLKEVTSIITEINDSVSNVSNENITKSRNAWLKLHKALIKSRKRHINEIIVTSDLSKSKKMNALAHLESLEFECSIARFELRNPKKRSMTKKKQDKLLDKCKSLRKECDTIKNNKLFKMQNMNHFVGQCIERINKILKDIDEIEEVAAKAGILTREEKMEIHRAMASEFRGSGHWYQCPNGHPKGICPECGETIGGAAHVLTATNRRDNEFESMGSNTNTTPRFNFIV
ncbi:12644_t:CDS:10 [Entrophospora sp. SA101]|nr:12644_t:CDS:10 [Entrophospora sp. SA101]